MHDYYLDKARAEARAARISYEAERSRLAAAAGIEQPADEVDAVRAWAAHVVAGLRHWLHHDPRPPRRTLGHGLPLVLLFAVLTLATGQAAAQSIEPGAGEPGVDEPFPATMVAVRLGNYYFYQGDYDRAIHYYRQAVAELPLTVYVREPSFANLYLCLGDAQAANNDATAARSSYRMYLMYTGGTGHPDIVAQLAPEGY